MKTSKLLFAALASLMLLTTACGKSNNNSDSGTSGTGISENCTNCTGFVSGPTVFSGNVASGAFRIDGLTVVADQNSLSTVFDSSPRINGTYQGIPTGGTFVVSGSPSACVPDGSYSIQGLTVGMISPTLSVQASNPMWVTLSGPTTFKVPMYIVLHDSNGDDIGDAGSTVYLWFYCNGGWSSVGMQ